MLKGILLWGLAGMGLVMSGETIEVGTPEELASALKDLEPGSRIQMESGEWNNLDIVIEGWGNPGQPIIIEAKEPGKVRLTGATSIQIAGRHITLAGLHFDRAYLAEGREALISLRTGEGKVARDCRLTDLYFDHCNPEDPLENYPWIRMYGHNNRVDHCRFEGQDHKGRAIQVRVYEENPAHRIDHNYFLDRYPGEESNGYEVIQVGLSTDSMKAGNVVMERNIFENCDGETEIISSKSWNNIIRQNRFLSSSGTVTLRHGKNCEVIDNLFSGGGKAASGGVRVVDSGHNVEGNHFTGLTGRTGGVIVLYCGIPDSPLNGYFPASDVLIKNNTFVGNSGNAIYLTGGFGSRNRILLPEDVVLEANALGRPTSGGVVAIAGDGNLQGLQLKDNVHDSGMETGLSPSTGLRQAGNRITTAEPPSLPGYNEVGPRWLPDLPELMLLDEARLRGLHQPGTEIEEAVRDWILSEANDIIKEGTVYSVTFNDRTPPSGDIHDYYSTGPYWWPDPDTEDGLPYIRIDGKFNPERDRVSDRQPFTDMAGETRILALAHVLSSDPAYGEHAAKLLRTWFLDESTRMNPNLNHAQAIPGVTDGRGTGIIDTHPFVELVDAISLVQHGGFLTNQESAQLGNWLADFADWMIYSTNGSDERDAKNNHGTAYDMQLAALLWKTGQKEKLRQYLVTVSLPRIGAQIKADGRQPLELSRTRTWSYCTENLEHFFKLGVIAEKAGVDLFQFTSEEDSSLSVALDFLLPYICDPDTWPYEQKTAWQDHFIRNVLSIAQGVYPDKPIPETLDCLGYEGDAALAWLLGRE
ncbi:MAG: alginate lyase family protein [Puniceicoccaceae bacterium]